MNPLLLLLLLPLSRSAFVNSTVDDTFPDPLTGRSISYTPPAAWNSGQNCHNCTAHPTEALLRNQTWHDSTFNAEPGSNAFPNTPLSAIVSFTGTAIYVFCALARTTSEPTRNSDMTFFIDGHIVGTFIRNPPGTMGYDYDVLVYSNTTLKNKAHEFVLQNGHVNGPKSLVLLDSIIYTYDNGEPSVKRASIIIGATLGGLAGIALLLLAFVIWDLRRRRLRQEMAVSHVQSPVTTTGTTPNNRGYPMPSVPVYKPGPAAKGNHKRQPPQPIYYNPSRI